MFSLMPCISGARCRVACKNKTHTHIFLLSVPTELLHRAPSQSSFSAFPRVHPSDAERRTARAANAMFGTFDSDDDDGPMVLYVQTRDCAGGCDFEQDANCRVDLRVSCARAAPPTRTTTDQCACTRCESPGLCINAAKRMISRRSWR